MKSLFCILFGLILCSNSIRTFGQPTITASGPLEFCAGESVTLCVEPAYQSYLWCSGSTTQCIEIFESGDYCVIVADSGGNIDSTFVDSTITVIVHDPEPIILEWGQSIVCTNQFVSWQWCVDGDSIPGETSPSITPDSAGIYTVKVVDEFGCIGVSNSIEFPFPAGIEDEESLLFNAFPNPTSGNVRIDFGEPIDDSLTLSVLNPLGQVVHRQQLNRTQSVDIELPEPDGIYLFQLLSSDGKSSTLRVVKK